ncbi:MAG: prolipoprotein diacylglyceryl transferase [Magnetococcales bacterium]|nr:prolipoprotein diacylglyceryl transferase [Magnetococcales bacterium]
MFPVLYSFGNIQFHTYGASLFVSLMVIYFLARRATPGSLLTLDHIDDLMLIIIISLWLGGGIIHLLFSAFSGTWNWQDLFDIQTLQQFSVFPVALATTLAMALWCRWKKLPLTGVIDFLIPFLTLGYGLHRILGCFNAGCCYGTPTSLPWGVVFPPHPGHAEGPPAGIALHPTQIYLGLSAFLTWWFLHRFKDALRHPGARTAAGLAGLSGSYFIIAFVRDHPGHASGYNESLFHELLSFIITAITISITFRRWNRN